MQYACRFRILSQEFDALAGGNSARADDTNWYSGYSVKINVFCMTGAWHIINLKGHSYQMRYHASQQPKRDRTDGESYQ